MTPPAEQMRFSTANCGPNYVWPPRQRSRTYVSVNSMLQCNLSTRVVIRVPGISLLISSLSLTLPADGWMMNDAKNFRRCGGVKVFLLLLLQRDDACWAWPVCCYITFLGICLQLLPLFLRCPHSLLAGGQRQLLYSRYCTTHGIGKF